MIKKSLLLALAVSLAACGNETQTADEIAAPDATQSPTTNPLIERFDKAVIVVDANGVGPKGATPFRFGTARGDVDPALAKAFGAPAEQGENFDCGAGPMQFSSYGPLQVAYQDGKLAGWYLRAGDRMATSDGVQPGTTTMDGLMDERQVREINTTLPGEFEYTTADYGTIGGFAENGVITSLHAGMTCFFR